jgi:hypothetical protein
MGLRSTSQAALVEKMRPVMEQLKGAVADYVLTGHVKAK